MVLESLADTWQLWFILGLVVVSLVLFFTEIIPLEITALGIPVVLAASGILEPLDAFSGFSNPATLTVLMMFILSAGIMQSGVIDWLADRLSFLQGSVLELQVLVMALLAGVLSAFINNTAAVAVLMPLVIQMASRSHISPGKLLMPLSFAAMLGGTMTLIGTSTNLLASSLRREAGFAPFGMFEFTEPAFVLFAIGVVYLFLSSRWTLPSRIKPRRLDERYHLREFLVEVAVPAEGPLIGRRVGEAKLTESYDAEVLQVSRGGTTHAAHRGLLEYQAGDRLLIRATRANIQRMVDTKIVDLVPTAEETGDELEDFDFAELLISGESTLRGRRLGDLGLWSGHRVQAVALLTRGKTYTGQLPNWQLRVGDVLLVVGAPRDIENLSSGSEFHVLGGPEIPLRRPHKVAHALAILVAVVALAAFDVAPIVVTATGGAVLMVVLGVLRLEEMYRNIHWDVIFLLAGIIPLGIALEATGATVILADLMVGGSASISPLGLLAIIYVATALLTNLVSNNAAVVLAIPVAIELAERIGADPTAFVLAAMFAASNAYLTPVGYQTNLLVMAPGGYRYWDYMRQGLPLSIIMAVATPFVLNHYWPVG